MQDVVDFLKTAPTPRNLQRGIQVLLGLANDKAMEEMPIPFKRLLQEKRSTLLFELTKNPVHFAFVMNQWVQTTRTSSDDKFRI